MGRQGGGMPSLGKRSIAAEDRLRARGKAEEADQLHKEELVSMGWVGLSRSLGPVWGYAGCSE